MIIYNSCSVIRLIMVLIVIISSNSDSLFVDTVIGFVFSGSLMNIMFKVTEFYFNKMFGYINVFTDTFVTAMPSR